LENVYSQKVSSQQSALKIRQQFGGKAEDPNLTRRKAEQIAKDTVQNEMEQK
jgi:hypothetical protein